jgi:hypothetical protein
LPWVQEQAVQAHDVAVVPPVVDPPADDPRSSAPHQIGGHGQGVVPGDHAIGVQDPEVTDAVGGGHGTLPSGEMVDCLIEAGAVIALLTVEDDVTQACLSQSLEHLRRAVGGGIVDHD